jgi:hypothetical protein
MKYRGRRQVCQEIKAAKKPGLWHVKLKPQSKTDAPLKKTPLTNKPSFDNWILIVFVYSRLPYIELQLNPIYNSNLSMKPLPNKGEGHGLCCQKG